MAKNRTTSKGFDFDPFRLSDPTGLIFDDSNPPGLLSAVGGISGAGALASNVVFGQENARRDEEFRQGELERERREREHLRGGYRRALEGPDEPADFARRAHDTRREWMFDLPPGMSFQEGLERETERLRREWRVSVGRDPDTGEPPRPEGATELARRLQQRSAEDAAGAGEKFRETVDRAGLEEGFAGRETTGRLTGIKAEGLVQARIDQSEAARKTAERRFGQRSELARLQLRDLLTGYGNRLQTGMGLLESAGTQERRDINQQYNRFAGQVSADATRRGLTESTIGTGLQVGVERSRADALGGAADRLTQQRTGLYSDLSGQGLNAQLETIALQAGISLDDLRNMIGQQAFASQLSADQIALLQSNKEFGAGLSADTLGARASLGAAELDYTTGRYDTDLNRQYELGQFPIDVGLQGVDALTRFDQSVTRTPPEPLPLLR